MKHKDIRTVLVTGGAGFIGSWIVDALLAEGYRLVILDTLGKPTHDGKLPAWVSKRATFIHGSVAVKSDWQRALKDVDAVIHLAARMDYHPDFSSYVDVNVRSVALLFELIAEKKARIKHLILASSQAVYGEGPLSCALHGVMYPAPRREAQLNKKNWEHECSKCGRALRPVAQKEVHELHPMNPYGLSKRFSEELAFGLGRQEDVPVTAFRYSIALGPRQSFRHFYSGALRSFAVDALTGRDIAMHEDGEQVRDFVDVRDLAQAHVKALGNKKAYFHVFNIGSGKRTKVIELARMIAREAGVPFRPSFNARYRVGAPRHGAMDASKIRKTLGWSAKTPLARTVADYLRWLSQQKGLRAYLDKTERDMKRKGLLKDVR